MQESEMRKLKVGQLVEDCGYNIVVIRTITKEYYPCRFVHRMFLYLPDRIVIPVDNFLRKRWVPGFSEHGDSDLKLSNGRNCSAIHCCDLV